MSVACQKSSDLFLRSAGKRTAFIETMYILDLSLDQRCAALPLIAVPWGRNDEVLRELNLEPA